MKKPFLLLFICLTKIAFCQNQNFSTTIVKDTLTTSTGYKIIKGDDVKIGTGSMPDGDFKFIRTNSISLFAYYSTTGYQGLANQANAFPRSNSGLKFKVARVEQRGNKKNGFVNYIVLSGFKKYEVDINNAILSGEINLPNEFKPKTSSSSNINISVADELKKFKELLDAGAITKEEYDAKKKQLLGL